MRKIKYTLLAFLILLIFNCKASKTITGGDAHLNLATKQVIKENTKQKAIFKTLQSKLKISYNQGDNTQTYSVSFRLKKDEVIWISAAFSVVKALITPEKVSFYNKIDNTYFDGDYKYLSDLLGTELDFEKVQNLLLGEAIFNLKADTYTATVRDKVYILQPKKQEELFEIFFLLDPIRFKIKSQQITQPNTQRHLQIDYLSYQDIDKQILPERIKILAVEAHEEVGLEFEFKGLTLNEDLKFPFSIPSGFKEIKL